jgi:hypothetical protein
MSAEDYADLLETVIDLKRPTAPIRVDRKNRIIDGRAQLRACIEAGIDPTPYVERDRYEGTDYATEVWNSMKGSRYTRAQVTLVGAILMGPLKAEKARQRGLGVREKFPKVKAGKAADVAADGLSGTNGKYVALLEPMVQQRKYRDLIGLIEDGTLPQMTQVFDIAEMTPAKRERTIERLRAGETPAEVLPKPSVRDDLWLTPPNIIAAIREAFGGKIACDPCAPIEGGSYVNATHPYTELENGLDYENSPWYDGTFVNPPFSTPEPWILRALREAKVGKRIYMLMPVNPGTEYHAALLNRATDVLYIRGRVKFLKPGKLAGGVGRKGIMIVGLRCSTRPLFEMGILGDVVGPPEWREVTVDTKGHIHVGERPPDESFDIGAEEIPVDSEEVRREVTRVLNEQQDAEEALIAKGRVDVAAAEAEMEAAKIAAKAAKKAAKASKAAKAAGKDAQKGVKRKKA